MDRMCQLNRLATHIKAGQEKPVRVEPDHDVRTHRMKFANRSDLWSAILSAEVCGNYLTMSDAIVDPPWSIRRWNPPCNVEDKLRVGLVIIEA